MDALHYTECGLDNVVIHGIHPIKDDDDDDIITIPAVNELHKEIALGIVSHEHGITGQELRFLRTEMGYTQSELASVVHHEKQAIGRWERAEIDIDGSAETIIRKLAIEKLNLKHKMGIDDLSKRSIPSASTQSINIQKDASNNYQLMAA